MKNIYLLSNQTKTSVSRRIDSVSLPSRCRVMPIILLFLTAFSLHAWGADPVTISIADVASANSWVDATQYSSWSSGDFTFTASGGGGNTGKYYNSNKTWRIYLTGTVTITPASGYSITAVSSSPSQTWTISEGSASWTRGGGSGNVAFTSFTITYTSGGSTTYSITYNCDGADSGCPSNASGQTALPNPLPDAPVKAGHTFGGWYTNSEKTIAAVAGATLSADITLYAKWTESGGGGGGCSYDLSTSSYASATTDLVTWSSNSTATMTVGGSSTSANNYLPPTRTSSRFYSGATLTITPKAGKNITSIVFPATTNSYATALAGCDSLRWFKCYFCSN